ncbi:MAG: AgmX/PglI C-terminal domain-containing protein [Bdellovibrionales bacterium]
MQMRKVLFLQFLLWASIANSQERPDFFGSIDREAATKVIEGHTPDLRKCYDPEFKKSPNLSGILTLEMDIGPGGKVTDVKVIRSISKKVDQCGKAKAAQWIFPSPPKGQVARIRYPFVFAHDSAVSGALPYKVSEGKNSFTDVEVDVDTGKAPLAVSILGPPSVMAQKDNRYLPGTSCGFSVQWGDGDRFPRDLKTGDACAAGFSHTYKKAGLYKIIFLLTEPGDDDLGKVIWKGSRAVRVE